MFFHSSSSLHAIWCLRSCHGNLHSNITPSWLVIDKNKLYICIKDNIIDKSEIRTVMCGVDPKIGLRVHRPSTCRQMGSRRILLSSLWHRTLTTILVGSLLRRHRHATPPRSNWSTRRHHHPSHHKCPFLRLLLSFPSSSPHSLSVSSSTPILIQSIIRTYTHTHIQHTNWYAQQPYAGTLATLLPRAYAADRAIPWPQRYHSTGIDVSTIGWLHLA